MDRAEQASLVETKPPDTNNSDDSEMDDEQSQVELESDGNTSSPEKSKRPPKPSTSTDNHTDENGAKQPQNHKEYMWRTKKITKLEKSMPENLTEELCLVWKLLYDLTKSIFKNAVYPFMDRVDEKALGLLDYYHKVKRPMWLNKIFQKLERYAYSTILDVLDDFYLMIENCLRYNGPDHPISKRALKLDAHVTQRIATLPREIKKIVLATMAENSGHHQNYDMKRLAQTLRSYVAKNRRNAKKYVMMEKRTKRQLEGEELNTWFNELIGHEKEWEEFKAMPELPQIGHMIYLCQEALYFPEIHTHQTLLERSLYMPRESTTLNKLMTVLVQSPCERLKFFNLRRGSYTYIQWNNRVQQKIAKWYKRLRSVKNIELASMSLCIEPKFFSVCGTKNPLSNRRFHEITAYQRIWIVKSLIDQIVATQEPVKEAIETNPSADQTEYILGMDAQGFTYVHFPQFCGNDIRVYRCAPEPQDLPILRPYHRPARKRPRPTAVDEDDSDTNSVCSLNPTRVRCSYKIERSYTKVMTSHKNG